VSGRFPADFLWGVATSAYQIEGGADRGGRGPSIWDTFSHEPGATLGGATGDIACDHYHRFAEDVEIMADMGVNAYRFSLSWSRILPFGTWKVSQEGIDFYRHLCEELASAGITPLVTLYHWDLPQALQDRDGWLAADSVQWFAEYAVVAKEALGGLVTTWATFNEPWCTAFLGHSAGTHAPGITDPRSAYVVAHHLMLAHHAAVDAMRQTAPSPDDRFGAVLNLIPAWPADPESEQDQAAATAADAVHNRLFADAVLGGTIPDPILDEHRRLGITHLIDPAELAAGFVPSDYLGVNYYNINRFGHVPGSSAPGAWPNVREAVLATPPGPRNEMDWASEPHGLTWMLERIASEYPPIPIIICENGVALPDEVEGDGSVDDGDRIRFLEDHIAALATAVDRGVDVRGYMVWSLLDNFEWARGYSKKFGLVRVDPDTLERTVKASGRWYREFISSQRSTVGVADG
jgi:beta-glucosidase